MNLKKKKYRPHCQSPSCSSTKTVSKLGQKEVAEGTEVGAMDLTVSFLLSCRLLKRTENTGQKMQIMMPQGQGFQLPQITK